jgi:CRP-like cAMP-binding protein
MADGTLLEALKKVPLFEDLSDRELGSVASVGREVERSSGSGVTTEGESGVGFHLILQGTADVAIGGSVARTLGPGDHFGEISLIDGGPRTATVTATSELRTFSIAAWDFGPLLDKHPEITRKILVGLCRVIRAQDAAAN